MTSFSFHPPVFIKPILIKELRVLLRSPRAFWMMLLALTVIGGLFCLIWWQMTRYGGMGRVMLARQLFSTTATLQLIAFSIISPVLTAMAITGEREQKTLDLLLTTRLTRAGILLGKWISAITYQLVLVACMLPILALVFILGGVGADEYLFSALMIGQVIVTYGMLGLAVSSRSRRSLRALFIALALVICLSVVLPLISILYVSLRYIGIPGTGSTSGFISMVADAVSPMLTWWKALFMQLMTGGAGGQTLSEMLALPIVRHHLCFQAVLFLCSALYAWRNLVRAEALGSMTAPTPISDPKLLRRRRLRFPFYLVDPLRGPQSIGDDQNPLVIKERRVGGMARLPTLIRMSYGGLLLSPLLMLRALDHQDVLAVMASLARSALAFTLVFAPILAATAITREREEGTLDLLLTAPLAAHQVVLAKFRVVMRFLSFLAVSVLLVPVAVRLVFVDDRLSTVYALLKLLPFVAAFLALYAAVGIYLSARSRRNVTAIVATYATLWGLTLTPLILISIDKMLKEWFSTPFSIVLAFGCPFISPFYALEPALGGNWDDPFLHNEHWWAIALHAAVVFALAGFVLWRAAGRLGAHKSE